MQSDHRFIEFPFVDYLLVFISIIVGYIVTEFFAGWGGIIRNRHLVKPYWLHMAWSVHFFFQLIENWWWLWGNRLKIAEQVWYFFFSLATPMLFYLNSVILFPDLGLKSSLDMKEFFYVNKGFLFRAFALLMGIYILNNVWIREQNLWSMDNLYCASGILFAIPLAKVRSERFQIASFVLGSVVFVSYVVYNNQHAISLWKL